MSIEIKLMPNGPIVIPGKVSFTDADGNEQSTPGTAVALCRCGASSNKPFCDGTHNKVGFEGAEITMNLDA